MKYSKLTDVGKVRKNNEDHLGAWDELGLFVVADGMGGHQAGEVASKIAVETIESFFRQDPKSVNLNPSSLLEKAINEANDKIYQRARQDKDLRGMGTTITAGFISGNQVFIGQVGDSRAYQINHQGIQQLTEDHSLVNELLRLGGITKEEAITHPQRNVLTRALGVELSVEADFYNYQLKKGDFLLFCTDGLSGLVPKEEIFNVVTSDLSLDVKVHQLIGAALQRGGTDNISVILVEVE